MVKPFSAFDYTKKSPLHHMIWHNNKDIWKKKPKLICML